MYPGQQFPNKKLSEDFNSFMLTTDQPSFVQNQGQQIFQQQQNPQMVQQVYQQVNNPNQKFETELDYFQEQQTEQKPQDPSGYIQPDESQMQKTNTNSKNVYIRKIHALMKNSADNLNELDSSGQDSTPLKLKKKQRKSSADNLMDDGKLSINGSKKKSKLKQIKSENLDENDLKLEKLARNCESARNSRKRKKMYLELLENKVIQLSEFLEESKQICQANQNLLQNLNNQIAYKNELQSNKVILFQNLNKAIECNTNENNINSILDSMQKKFGTTNQERLMVLDYAFKQIDQQGLPIHMKYLLWAAANNKDIFNDNDIDDIKEEDTNNNENKKDGDKEVFPNIIKGLKLNETQHLKVKKMKKKLAKESKKMDNLMGRLHETKETMKKELFSLDQIMVMLRKEFKPSQISKFLQNCMGGTNDQAQIRSGFNKYFGEKVDEQGMGDSDDDDDDDTNLYQFIKNDAPNSQLMVDINDVYDIYAGAHDFLDRKKNLSIDII